jgi:hypothetical protein
MAVRWDMAAVIAALVVFVFPYISKKLGQVIGLARAKSRRCIRFKWKDDIPVGRVHDCAQTAGQYSCYHDSHHERASQCWHSQTSLACMFDRAWKLSEKRPYYVKHVPEDLPHGTPFLCTDARTILGFVLCTVNNRKGQGLETWHQESLTYGLTRIICETIGNVHVAHIQGRSCEERQFLTKHELGCMLDGYPPWYRESFETRNGIKVHFPIASEQDIPRAGWVLAVGLMDDKVKGQKPLALYRCPNEPQEPGFRQNGGIFRQAVARCRDHIVKNILPHFPNDPNVLAAIEALHYLVEQRTGSGMPTRGEFGRSWTSNIPHLRSSDYQFAFANFNAYSRLEDADKARYTVILLPTMAAAVQGAYDIVEYLKDTGMELKIPSELQPFDREIWLRDCATRLPIK